MKHIDTGTCVTLLSGPDSQEKGAEPMVVSFASPEEVDKKFNEIFDKGSAKLIRELFYHTLRDALSIAERRADRLQNLRPQGRKYRDDAIQCGGSYTQIDEAKKQLADWIGSEAFDRFSRYLGGEGAVAAEFIWDVANGKRAQEARELLNELNHAPRSFNGRGPSKKIANKGNQE